MRKNEIEVVFAFNFFVIMIIIIKNRGKPTPVQVKCFKVNYNGFFRILKFFLKLLPLSSLLVKSTVGAKKVKDKNGRLHRTQ